MKENREPSSDSKTKDFLAEQKEKAKEFFSEQKGKAKDFIDGQTAKAKVFLVDQKIKAKEFLTLQTKKTYTGLFKDLEISKGQFITLCILATSFAIVLLIDIFLSIEAGQGLQVISSAYFIVIGLLSGLLIGGFVMDKIHGNRYKWLLRCLFVSVLITFSHISFFRRTGDIVPNALFLGNSFIAGLLFMFLSTFFVDFTTILEKGRVFSYIIIVTSIAIGFVIVIVLLNIFILLPAFLLLLFFAYLYKYPEKEEPYKPVKSEKSEREINIEIVKYTFLLGIFGLIIGLIIPIEDYQRFGRFQLSLVQLAGVLIIAVIFSFATVIIEGAIFDFSGRKASISNVILAISIVNFTKLFDVSIPFFNVALSFVAILASFMAIPLLISDISHRKNLGKILALTFSVVLTCIFLGVIIETFVLLFFEDKYIANIFLVGVINFASIIGLFFLVNVRETLSSKEANWPDALLHIYIVHESGVLLYEHSFERENLAESDLISGGFVGLITMLQEITREEQRLKIIDHGGKKILFGFNFNKSLIFALIIKEELYVLRSKLNFFIQDIEEQFVIPTEEFNGVDVELWKKRISPILEKHFKRKYFQLASDLLPIDLNIEP